MGATCATVTPRDRQGCCETKDAENIADAWCADNWPVVQVPARLPAELHPASQPKAATCRGSAQGLPALLQRWCGLLHCIAFAAPPPRACSLSAPACGHLHRLQGAVGTTCATVTPGENEACCATKAAANEEDEWCTANFPAEATPVIVGSSCGTVTPGQNEACCEGKVADNTVDEWCVANFPQVRSIQGPAAALSGVQCRLGRATWAVQRGPCSVGGELPLLLPGLLSVSIPGLLPACSACSAAPAAVPGGLQLWHCHPRV